MKPRQTRKRTSIAPSASHRLMTAGIRFLLRATPIVAGATGTFVAAQERPAVKGWEVAGVKLGMNDRQAEAVLRARGYVVERKEQTFDFQERVQVSMGKTVRTSSAVGELTARKGQEKVRLHFVQFATGSSVSEITYNVPLGQVSGAEAVAMMNERLGPPPAKRSRPGGAVWCKDGSNPRYCDQLTASVEVSSYEGTGTSIVMKAGRNVDMRAEAEVAIAAKAVPNRLKPSF